MDRFAAGDPLRAIAALSVLVLHWAIVADSHPEATFGELLARLLVPLSVGVNIFFVLSGYLIARPFIRAYLDGAQPPRLGRYLRHRARRILPPYWVVLTLVVLLHGTYGSSVWGVLDMYAFLQVLLQIPMAAALPQAWSVSVEVGFYLLVPVAAFVLTLAARGADRRRRVALLGCALTATWVASALLRNGIPTTIGPFGDLQLSLLAFTWALVPGMALAAIEQSRLRASAWAQRPALPAALLVLVACAYAGMVAADTSPTFSRSLGLVVLATVVSGGLVAAPLTLQWSGRPCWRWLDNEWLRWVGMRSYSLYLLHIVVLRELRFPVLGPHPTALTLVWFLVLATAISLLLAHISYVLVERPFMERRLPWRRALPQVAVTA